MYNIETFKETEETLWCIKCGFSSWTNKGKSSNGKQRLKCKVCGTSVTVGGNLPGVKSFNPDKLLPVLRKSPLQFTAGELYSLGVLTADGGRKGKGSVDNMCLSISTSDSEVLEIVKQHLQFPNEIKHRERKRVNRIEYSSILQWSNKWAGEYWDKLGLVRNKTGNEVWLPYMECNHFVRGFTDGDGCITYNPKKQDYGTISWSCASLPFLTGLQMFFHNQLATPINKIQVRKKKREYYVLKYRKRDAIKICEWMYKDSEGLRLERKFNKYMELRNELGTYISY